HLHICGQPELDCGQACHALRHPVHSFCNQSFSASEHRWATGRICFHGGLTSLKGGAAPNGYNAWADFLLGLPNTIQKDIQFLNPAALRESQWGAFARDQWQISSKLTFNYGIRYEFYPLATTDHHGLFIFNPTDGNVYAGGVNGVPEN